MGKKMSLYLVITIVALLLIAALLVVALYVKGQQQLSNLSNRSLSQSEKIAELTVRVQQIERANRRGLPRVTDKATMGASYATNRAIEIVQTELIPLLTTVNSNLEKAQNPRQYTKTE